MSGNKNKIVSQIGKHRLVKNWANLHQKPTCMIWVTFPLNISNNLISSGILLGSACA